MRFLSDQREETHGTIPPDVRTMIEVFRPLFSARVWPHAQLLLVGSLLTVGRRTVTAVLRTMGLSGERRFKTIIGC